MLAAGLATMCMPHLLSLWCNHAKADTKSEPAVQGSGENLPLPNHCCDALITALVRAWHDLIRTWLHLQFALHQALMPQMQVCVCRMTSQNGNDVFVAQLETYRCCDATRNLKTTVL